MDNETTPRPPKKTPLYKLKRFELQYHLTAKTHVECVVCIQKRNDSDSSI